MVEQMYGDVTKLVEVYRVTVESLAVDNFIIELECINAEKGVITYLPNPRIEQQKRECPRIRRLTFNEEGTEEDSLPVHIMLGVADFQRIRTTESPILGKNPNIDPGAEFTMFGWTLLGGARADVKGSAEKQFLLCTGQEELEN